MHGHLSWSGWTTFFPVSFAIKTPLEFFLLLAMATWTCCTRPFAADRREQVPQELIRLYTLTPLIVLLGVYGASAMLSGLNIGYRHVLPMFAPLCILAGASAALFQNVPERLRRSGVLIFARVIVVIMLASNAAEAIWIWPDYLAYFNVVAGGPRHGYRWLVDSSLDWGQDLKGLEPWLAAHPDDAADPQHVYLSYFGVAKPDYYRIRAELLPSKGIARPPQVPRPLTGGLYCTSATMLAQVYLRPRGRWNVEYERLYQEGCRMMSEIQKEIAAQAQNVQNAAPTLPPELEQACELFEELRWVRLCSFLRVREPDDNVGYSILIYRLSDVDVREALEGPPRELLPRPETERAGAVK